MMMIKTHIQITVSKTNLADTKLSSNRITIITRPRRNRSWLFQICKRSWRIPTKIRNRTSPIRRKIRKEERGIAIIRSLHLESSPTRAWKAKKLRRRDDLLEDWNEGNNYNN